MSLKELAAKVAAAICVTLTPRKNGLSKTMDVGVIMKDDAYVDLR